MGFLASNFSTSTSWLVIIMIHQQLDRILGGEGYKLVGAKDSSRSIKKFWKTGFIMEQTPLKLGDLSRSEQNG